MPLFFVEARVPSPLSSPRSPDNKELVGAAAPRERLTPSCCQPRESRSGPAPSRRSAPPGAGRSPPPPRRSRRNPPSCSPRVARTIARSATAATTQSRDALCARARPFPPSRLAGQVVAVAGRQRRRRRRSRERDPLAHIPAATLGCRHVATRAPSRLSRARSISVARPS